MSASIHTMHGSTCLRAAARSISREARCSNQSHSFSTSAPRWPRGVKGTNKLRGLSVTRASGPVRRRVQSIRADQLPVPVMDPAKRAKMQTSENHGLWGFFNEDKESLTVPRTLNEHGRAWAKKELRHKSLEDMHVIWWQCHLELNKLATETQERIRLEPGYGKYELEKRQDTLKDTQKAIREALQERYEAWQEAKEIINNDQDPDITVSDDGAAVFRGGDGYDPYEVDEMEDKIQPMTRSQQREPQQREIAHHD